MGKKVKYDIQCYECKKMVSSEEELELGNIEIIDDYLIYCCDKCGNTTFIKGKGYKSKKINY